MILLDGKKIREKIFDDMKKKVSKLDRKLTLAVVSTVHDVNSEVYVRSKKRMCEKVGYDFRYFDCGSFDTDELVDFIIKLNNYDDIDGILLQLPLKDGIDCERVIGAIDYKKDVDGLTDFNMGRLLNHNPYLASCTALGIVRMLEEYSIDIASKNVVIIGRSRLVGKALASMFLNMDATVTLCHSKSKNLEFYTKNADILVVAIGKEKFLKKEMVKEGCVVIDVGIHKLENGDIVGDVDFEDVDDVAMAITPVPGGVGPMTVAMLCENLYTSYRKRFSK